MNFIFLIIINLQMIIDDYQLKIQEDNIIKIFLSFSGEGRQQYAVKFLNFFNKYGIKCWYDHHQLLLGDLIKKEIVNKGIETVDYSIIIINKTFLSRRWPCEEAKKLYERFINNSRHIIFPILLDIEKDELKNSQINFLLNIKYQFLKSDQSIDKLGFQILNRILQDKLKDYKYSKIDILIFDLNNRNNKRFYYLYSNINILEKFNETDYNNKTIILICLTRFFKKISFIKIINNITDIIIDKKDINFDIYKIIESIFLINASNNITCEDYI